tara:strand:+ start:605 stop:1204 length:600 start_codon:yes stop_codon:yes gene_type:complete
MEIAVGIGSYYALNNKLKKIETNTKIRNNYLSTLHVVITLCAALFSHYSGKHVDIIFRGNTYGFFINEMVFFFNSKFSISVVTLSTHHLIMMGLMYNCSKESLIMTCLLPLGELTNLPGNIIYHTLQLKNKYPNKSLYYFQFILYSFGRIFLPPYFIFQEFTSEESVHDFFKVTMMLIYIMGIIWSHKLYKKCQILYYE